jgi:hypothetical protein
MKREGMRTITSPRQPPYGLLELDGAGIVRQYAPIKGQPPAVTAKQVIGKHFFSEILPFEQARGFQRVFEYFMAQEGEAQRMSFPIMFDSLTVQVQVMMASFIGQTDGARRQMALVQIRPERMFNPT